MGNSGSRYSDFQDVTEAHEAVHILLRDNPDCSVDTQNTLRLLRSEIYDALDGERSARISIYVEDLNKGEPFKFKIRGGKQHLVINIVNDEVKFQFSTGRNWTTLHRGITKFFMTIAQGANGALKMGAKKLPLPSTE